MRSEKKKIVVETEVEIYIADDGMSFECFDDCFAYEQKEKRKKLDMIKQCNTAKDYANCNGGENMEAHEYTWYRPESEADIDIINECIDSRVKLYTDDIGKWVCVEEGESFAWVTRLDDGIKHTKFLLEQLGYDLVITERKDANCD